MSEREGGCIAFDCQSGAIACRTNSLPIGTGLAVEQPQSSAIYQKPSFLHLERNPVAAFRLTLSGFAVCGLCCCYKIVTMEVFAHLSGSNLGFFGSRLWQEPAPPAGYQQKPSQDQHIHHGRAGSRGFRQGWDEPFCPGREELLRCQFESQ
jgi:hypothetical protein